MDELVARLVALPYSGAVADILQENGYPNQVLPPSIQAVTPGSTIAGRAVTVEGKQQTTGERDDFLVPYLEMLGTLAPGDVIVIQANDDLCAHIGELSSETARHRGAYGAVIDGGVRDVDYIAKLGFPVFARYRTPVDIVDRWALQSYGDPITIGRTRIQMGDLVIADSDGVVIIPSKAAEEVITAAERVVTEENFVRKAILDGVDPVHAYHRYGRF
jgi:regulator of RNase E activity RraA